MIKTLRLTILLLVLCCTSINAQQRRPIDATHPLWMIHADVWYKADPQKIIDLIPEDIRPYAVLNLSLSCQFDADEDVYKMPQNAIKCFKSWGTVCQLNNIWFTCQPASGGHTHIPVDDLDTFEYFFKAFPNFLGWNYAEQFWGFDEDNRGSANQVKSIALFAKLVEMSHKYGGFLTISYCGNKWSHGLSPVGMMKRNSNLLNACRKYPEAILWLYKYTQPWCLYNSESVSFSPFISGLANNYGIRYDQCAYAGSMDATLGKDKCKYPTAAGIGTSMEQVCVNGATVWDGPELTWQEDFKTTANTTVNGYTRRNWATFPSFDNAWIDMFRKIIDRTMYIPSRKEVVDKTKIVIVNNITSGSDEEKYASWGDLYNGLYKQNDPTNKGNGQFMDNLCYFKKTGRYGAIPVAVELYDSLSKTIPVQVKKSVYSTRWSTETKKVNEFNKYYPEVSTGDMYVNRYKNQLVTYTPYTQANKKTTSYSKIPLQYNTCDSLYLTWGKLCSGIIKEYADHIDFYLNNYRSDTLTAITDEIIITGSSSEPTYTYNKRTSATTATITKQWDSNTKHFKLSVKHMGPVDITVNCNGKATNKQTDILDNTKLTDLPKQPNDWYGDITIEAEDMDYKSIKSCVTDPYTWYKSERGHAGNGFADMGTNTAGSLRHELNLKNGGNYKIYIRYTTTSNSGSFATNVNGTKKNVQFEKTLANEWKRVSVDANLKAGKNTFTVTNTNGVAMYIDNITYHPADLPLEKNSITIKSTQHGKAASDVDYAAEGEVVTLSATPDDGYTLTGWKVIRGCAVINKKGSFLMTDENVTIEPIFSDKSSVYALDLTNDAEGGIPEGWRCIQENNEIHEYPNTFALGARIFTGFTGYSGKALYWRDNCAEYGRLSDYPLTLEEGWYKLSYANAAWKAEPKYKVQILSENNELIAISEIQSATPNAEGNKSSNVATAQKGELTFNITKKGNYIISFTNMDVIDGYDEFLLLQCRLTDTNAPTNIKNVNHVNSYTNTTIYNIAGQEVNENYKGIKIKNRKKQIML